LLRSQGLPCLARKVVKLKTYMLILNCCINVLSHRNRFEYRTTVFIEYFWSRIRKKKRSIGSATQNANRSRQLWYLPFPDFFKCHVKELIGAILWLSKSNQQGNVNFSKNLNRVNPTRTSILVKLQDLNWCWFQIERKISEPCA